MGTKLKSNFQKYWRLLSALDTHATLRNGLIYAVAILLIAILFFGIESLFEEFIYNNDGVADFVTALASTFVFLWLRSARTNLQLQQALRERSEQYTAELEQRVAEKTERIREMHEAQSKFLMELAHEFQTPIAILKGNIAVMAKPVRSNNARKDASGDLAVNRANAAYIATTTLDRLSRLVNSLLDIARLNFSKEKLGKQVVDIKRLIEDAYDDCAMLAEDKNISITLTSDAVFVAGDKDKLKEVLLNLLSNALKHTPANGSITITAERYSATEVEISVADTGSGIAPENLPQIFERFYRIENKGNPSRDIHGGTGLGLHICRKIVEAHGGTITVESGLGKGARFIIHLPLVEAVV